MMSRLWQQVAALITAGDVRISEHGYDSLADDGLTVDELLLGAGSAVVVEDTPIIRRALRCLFSSGVSMAARFMQCGVCLVDTIGPRCW